MCTNRYLSTTVVNWAEVASDCSSKSEHLIRSSHLADGRMIAKNPKSVGMFKEDLERTYGRIEIRTQEIIKEEAEDREQIQLVAQDPNMEIAFNLPDGPPPADLRLEGEGAEDMDIEQVRAFLERKWEIFENFDDEFKKALTTQKLDVVNKVLGKMKVAQAEEIVELLQEGGMLSFR